MAQKTVTVFRSKQYDGDWPFSYNSKLIDVISWLQDRLNEIPEPYQAGATCAFDSSTSYDISYASIEIKYVRPETDDERIQREAAERARQDEHRARELATLRALQAKYQTTTPELKPPPEQQPQHEHDQQQAADAAAPRRAAVMVAAEPAEQNEQHEND